MLGRLWFRLLAAGLLAVVPVIIAAKVFPPGQLTPDAPLPEFTAHLDRRIPAIMQDYEIPGLSVALIRKGKTVWMQAYGYADLEAGRKMTVDTYCRLESISKPVTAWGVIKLAEEGRIDLDAPVQQYLPSWQLPETEFDEQQVTVRRLLSGNAGMPLGTIGEYYKPGAENIPGLKEVLTEDAVLFREPGSGFSYSNAGFNLLELLIEEVTGRDFAAYMAEDVLQPLGMKGASYQWSGEFDPPVANGYGNRNTPIPAYVYPYKAAGNLFGTLGDVARFAAAGMPGFTDAHRGVLSRAAIDSMHSPVSEMSGYYRFVFAGYGLGHFVEYLPGGGTDAGRTKAVSHGGQGTGWMTDFHAVPETGDGIVILANSQRTWPGFAYILSDWAGWLGYTSVGMGVIVTVQKIAWAAVALVLAAAVWQLLRLAEGLLSGVRRFTPLAPGARGLRLFQFTAAGALIGLFLWTASLDYWFIDSVLPIASGWLDFVMLLGALVLAASAALPADRDSRGAAVAGPAAKTIHSGRRP
jgi:CubicO group peptidase (beta-lactamase class C family)